jgi:hypothetical protein
MNPALEFLVRALASLVIGCVLVAIQDWGAARGWWDA